MNTAHVYRNLNNGKWSIRQRIAGKWLVIGHADSVTLEGVTVRQSTAARDAVRKSGQRSVHCWAVGELVAVRGFVGMSERVAALSARTAHATCERHVTYNPHIHATLIYSDTMTPFTASKSAYFSDAARMMVSA